MAITTNFTADVIGIVGSLTKTEKVQFSEALFSNSVAVTDLTKDHPVLTGVRSGNYIPIINSAPSYESFPFSDANACAVPECDLDTGYSLVKWELGLQECKVPICLRSFDDDFLAFWNLYKMVQTDAAKNEQEYMQSALVQFLADKFKNNLLAAQWRAAYFGDKASASPLFNGINGFFTQAEANASQVVEIAENNGVDAATQTLTGARLYEILTEIYQNYMLAGWNATDAVEFRMTKKDAMILTFYFNGLKVKDKCCDGLAIVNPDTVQNAPYDYMRLTFFGIPIKVMSVWDEIINKTAELNPGWNGKIDTSPTGPKVNPHRILLTYKNNLVIGTQETSNLNFFDIWHSKDQDKIFMKGGAYFGAGIPMKSDYILAI